MRPHKECRDERGTQVWAGRCAAWRGPPQARAGVSDQTFEVEIYCNPVEDRALWAEGRLTCLACTDCASVGGEPKSWATEVGAVRGAKWVEEGRSAEGTRKGGGDAEL